MTDKAPLLTWQLIVCLRALWVSVCFLVLTTAQAFATPQIPTIDLAGAEPRDNLALAMAGFSDEKDNWHDFEEALETGPWQPIANQAGILKAPRQFSSIWLRATLINSNSEPMKRWLEFSPWRLNSIDIWILNPDTGELLKQKQTGLDAPIRNRQIDSVRSVVPVQLPAEGGVEFLVHIHADSRPFLTINSWSPVAFAEDESGRYLFHSMLLAVVLTLFVVLVLQFDTRYLLVGLWMLAMFVLEAEKEGYVSYLLFGGVADYAANLRFSSAMFSKALFMALSVWLLGLQRHWFWRWVTPVGLAIAVVFSGLTFVLDGVEARRLGLLIHVPATFLWLFMIPVALREPRRWQKSLLLLLGAAWTMTVLFSVVYILNIDYTAEFDTGRVVIDAVVVLGLLLVYARQKDEYEKALEHQIQERERQAVVWLEKTVAERTEALSLALEDARKANASKMEFLSRVTHDLKSPLTAISGYAQLLKPQGGKAAQMSDSIQGSARHMLALVNRLIDYAHDVTAVEYNPQPVHLPAFLKTLESEAHILAQQQGNVFQLREGENGCPTVFADEIILREVLINLIDNACKYTRKGLISLGVTCVSESRSNQTVLKLEVADTGCGIARDVQDKLFDPFYRVADNQAESGSGLGLSIVKELVEKMSGKVGLESEPGLGTKITVEIPVKIQQANASE
ncbi:MAG: hypothetical protein HLX50_00815 [Alteromonadaceae bacterium]|nr:hypothetical protein [Alteromonadaceae bacterium]